MNEQDERDDKTTLRVVYVFVAICVALLVAVFLWTSRARADTSPGLAYCALYAREATRIDVMHTMPVDRQAASNDYIESLAVQVFQQCVSILPTLLPLPEAHRNLGSWEKDIQQWVVSRLGTEPATIGEEDWAAQCAAEYRSWNPDDGTVVRKGSSEPVRCPCGREVDCSQ